MDERFLLGIDISNRYTIDNWCTWYTIRCTWGTIETRCTIGNWYTVDLGLDTHDAVIWEEPMNPA